MFVAKEKHHNRIITGAEIRSLNSTQKPKIIDNIVCPACNKSVKYHDSAKNDPLLCFDHTDGSDDCYASDVVSDEHRLCAEVVLSTLHNRVSKATEMPVDIDLERRIGDCSDFVITDVRVASPVKIAAEVYYKTPRLELNRRLSTMFRHDYGAFLIICAGGCHEHDRVEKDLSCLASLNVGHFEPQTAKLDLGDLFTYDNIDMEKLNYRQAPAYIIS